MHDQSHAFLKKLLETPSPSGFERPIQDVVRDWIRPYADEVRTDRHGNVLAVRHAAPGTPGEPSARHAGGPLRSDRPDGAAYRRQWLSLCAADRRLGHADSARPVPDGLGEGWPDSWRAVAAGAASADRRGTQQGAAAHRCLDRHRRQGSQGVRGAGVTPATR